MATEEIKMIVQLNMAKLEIIKLKHISMGYDWSMLGQEGQRQMEQMLVEINNLLETLTTPQRTGN